MEWEPPMPSMSTALVRVRPACSVMISVPAVTRGPTKRPCYDKVLETT